METKKCKWCGRVLPLSEFPKQPTMKDGHINKCKDCKRKYQKAYKDDIKSHKRIPKNQTKIYYLLDKETLEVVQEVTLKELCAMLGVKPFKTNLDNHKEVNGLFISEY